MQYRVQITYILVSKMSKFEFHRLNHGMEYDLLKVYLHFHSYFQMPKFEFQKLNHRMKVDFYKCLFVLIFKFPKLNRGIKPDLFPPGICIRTSWDCMVKLYLLLLLQNTISRQHPQPNLQLSEENTRCLYPRYEALQLVVCSNG